MHDAYHHFAEDYKAPSLGDGLKTKGNTTMVLIAELNEETTALDEETKLLSDRDDDDDEGGDDDDDDDYEISECYASHRCTIGGSESGWCLLTKGHIEQHYCGRCGSHFD